MYFKGSLEDRMAIRELIETYADAVTQRDAQVWASLWAGDSRWDMPDLGSGVSMEGKEEIVSSWLQMMEQYHGPADEPWSFSFVSSIGNIAVDGDRAKVRWYSTEVFADGQGNSKQLKGQCDDVLVRDGPYWLISERTWYMMPLQDYRDFQA